MVLHVDDIVQVRHVDDSNWSLARVEVLPEGPGRPVWLRLYGPVKAAGGLLHSFLPILPVIDEDGKVVGLTGDEYVVRVI